MIAIKYEEGGEAKLRLAHIDLIENEGSHSCSQNQAPKHEAQCDPTCAHNIQGLLLCNVVIWTRYAAHVLPHHIDQAACHQVVFYVEGKKDFKALPEGEAGCARVALTG